MPAALYPELLLEHARHPRNRGPLAGAARSAQRDNPFCGDQVSVAVALDGDRLIGVAFEGTGCAVAIASASMMTTALEGKSRAEAAALAARFFQLVSGGAGEELGELVAFAEVARYPVRVQCARLAWEALLAALS